MSYEEEDTCHIRRRIHVSMSCFSDPLARFALTNYIYEEEDTCHMRRRIDVI
jgi:hypothetical protein